MMTDSIGERKGGRATHHVASVQSRMQTGGQRHRWTDRHRQIHRQTTHTHTHSLSLSLSLSPSLCTIGRGFRMRASLMLLTTTSATTLEMDPEGWYSPALFALISSVLLYAREGTSAPLEHSNQDQPNSFPPPKEKSSIHTHTHTHTHIHTHIHTDTHTHTHTHRHTHTYTHTYTRTRTHTHIHTYTHKHTGCHKSLL